MNVNEYEFISEKSSDVQEPNIWASTVLYNSLLEQNYIKIHKNIAKGYKNHCI